MEVHFTPEQETQLSQIATHAGIDAERLVKDAALRLLQEEARFRAAAREGMAQRSASGGLWPEAVPPAFGQNPQNLARYAR